jgi:beta-glucosidase
MIKVDGDEIVQVYARTPESPASLQRPIKRLKGFKRVSIPAGKTQTVSIDVDCTDLWFWDPVKSSITFDQGKYIFEIGASSKDIKGKVEATMRGNYKPVLKTVVAECGKIIFKPGNVAQTSVTASLSDDSFINLNNAKIVYKSSNQSVSSVDQVGKVTAKSSGSALITVSVTYNGKTVSNSFPVKVMPNLNPASITVNGKEIDGFDKRVKAYSYLLENKSNIPTVKATAASNAISVEIQQAKVVPGTAVIKFVDEVTLEENIYYLNFDVASMSDEFNDGTVDKVWKWLRPNPANVSLSKKPGLLTVTSEVGDVSEATNNAKNVLLQSANSDWTIETKLICSRIPSQPENTGILVYENDNNFVKLMFRAFVKTTNPGRSGGETQAGTIDLIYEEKGITKSVGTFNVRKEITGDNSLILKLEKKGSFYTAYYSLDGTKYEKLAIADILLKDIKAGLIVCDGVITQNMKSTFWFSSTISALKIMDCSNNQF